MQEETDSRIENTKNGTTPKKRGQNARWKRYSEDELRAMAMESKSRKEFARMLGYPEVTSGRKAVKKVCETYNIEIPHWKTQSREEHLLPLSDMEIREIYENSDGVLEFGHAITNHKLNDAYVYKLAERVIKRLELPPKKAIRSDALYTAEEWVELITNAQDYQELEKITGVSRNSLYSKVSKIRKQFHIDASHLSNKVTLQFKNGRCYRDLSSKTYIRESRLFSFLASQGITTCSKCQCEVQSATEGHILHINNNCYDNQLENLTLLCTDCFFITIKKEREFHVEPLGLSNQNNRGIYIIIDLENNKIYVGKTIVTFRNRIREHLRRQSIPIDKALHDKGVENFAFGILENMNNSTPEEIARRERYWIEYYHSNLKAIGYNCPSAATYREPISNITVLLIHKLLLTTTKSNKEIAELCHVDQSYVSYVNSGKTRRQKGYHYPLRVRTHQSQSVTKSKTKHKQNKSIVNSHNQQNFCQCGKKIDKKAKACVECSHKAQMRFDVSRDELEKLILTKSFTQIGKMFGVSDNSVRKRARKFNLPATCKEIEEYKKKHHLAD